MMLAIMSSVSEDGKKMVSDAIRDMLAVKADVEAAQVKLHDQEETNRALLKEAQDQAAENAKMAANDEAKRRELAKKESEMGEVIAALNAEKTAFEEVRRTVEAQHKDRREVLDARAAVISASEQEIRDLMTKNTAEAKRLAVLGEKLNRYVAKAKEMLSELTDA